MLCLRQMLLVMCALSALISTAMARPDSAGHKPLPAPGIAYGGIPYGSMTGNVAEYFKRQAPSVGRGRNVALSSAASNVDFSPIEQWLR